MAWMKTIAIVAETHGVVFGSRSWPPGVPTARSDGTTLCTTEAVPESLAGRLTADLAAEGLSVGWEPRYPPCAPALQRWYVHVLGRWPRGEAGR